MRLIRPSRIGDPLSGITLVELLVVITIIGILIALTVKDGDNPFDIDMKP